jgi:Dyp-type peroxidase family
MSVPNLDNTLPINTADPEHQGWLQNLQGNILSGHGRDNTVHIFLRLPNGSSDARVLVAELGEHVTSAYRQAVERQQFKDFDISGSMFRSVLLSANGYRKLGFPEADLKLAFDEAANQPRPTASNFLDGMAVHAQSDLGDPPPADWDSGYSTADIDLMLLLADDDDAFLIREARRILNAIDGRCEIARVERGTALRNDDGEGIEHFGYVDGRSQPLFLSTDFEGLQNGEIHSGTREASGGRVDVWNPFEPLKLVLVKDPLTNQADCLGSFFVFRKLEQNVRDFMVAEQKLADRLGLKDADRERAGAMVVGRFRDGTPLALSSTDGLIPPKENNFRYDASGQNGDIVGAKCPFHAHIRKTNPRGDINVQFGAPEESERSHRIARRGITFGVRNRHPNAFQAIDDLPAGGVGLLFMCYQASIRNQFAFMQRGWANNQKFIKDGVTPGEKDPTIHPAAGLDPVIGQLDADTPGGPAVTPIPQTWRPSYGSTENGIEDKFGGFIRMRGGEFFFAPSIPFLRSLATGG